MKDQSSQVEDTAQLFLGLRIQCARCHHHPFEKWSQQDYYGFAAFFSQVGRKTGCAQDEERIFHQPRRGRGHESQDGQDREARPAWAPSRSSLAPTTTRGTRWSTGWRAKDNPFFARALVNRYWKHFFGRGLVDPEDDMRVTNPAIEPGAARRAGASTSSTAGST